MRIGFGFDVHQLSEDREFWLGGIKILLPKVY
jgi:2-C-methyl-D-erythritol 2,4-cyclodiphosphate synthase